MIVVCTHSSHALSSFLCISDIQEHLELVREQVAAVDYIDNNMVVGETENKKVDRPLNFR